MKLAYDMAPADQARAIKHHEDAWGIHFPGAQMFCRPEYKQNINVAMDAQPALVTVPNSGVPAYLTFFMDPDILRVLTAPNEAAEIFGEKQKGDWTSTTLIFPVVERTYEVSSYGDFNNNGRSGLNTNFPQREAYLYQSVAEYGELEMERAGLAKIDWAGGVRKSAVITLDKFQNLTYFYGVQGLQNYGLLNSPDLSAPIAPAPKANGGLTWVNGTVINATANEIFADIQSMFIQLINQSSGLIDANSKMTLAMSPKSSGALNTTNTFNVNVMDILKKNYPNMTVKTAVQYGALTTQNPQGSAGGEIIQLIAEEVEGQKTGYCAFNEKLRAGPVIREMSAFKQKLTQGTWGAVIRIPYAISQMIGV